MIENIKMIKMEIDSIKYIKNQKKTGEYEANLEKDRQNSNKKMEVLQIKSVNNILTFILQKYYFNFLKCIFKK